MVTMDNIGKTFTTVINGLRFSQGKFKLLCLSKATPIYLPVLRAQEVGNEPFWNKKKKLKNVTFFIIIFFFRV